MTLNNAIVMGKKDSDISYAPFDIFFNSILEKDQKVSLGK